MCRYRNNNATITFDTYVTKDKTIQWVCKSPWQRQTTSSVAMNVVYNNYIPNIFPFLESSKLTR